MHTYDLLTASAADSGSPLIPPAYDAAFVIIGVGMLLVTIVAIVVIYRSTNTTPMKVMLIVLSLALPVFGGIAALLTVVIKNQAGSTQRS